MTGHSRPVDPIGVPEATLAGPRERADRVLDAAADLLLSLGPRRTTVDEVARLAGIGKGTVYLHWRTKDELLSAMLLRESAGMLTELVTAVRRDPNEVLPHRFLRSSLLGIHRRPLLRALLARDTTLLGELADAPERGRALRTSTRLVGLLVKYGLLRHDLPDLPFALGATASGFLHAGDGSPDEAGRANALAAVIHRAFEPDDAPDQTTLTAAAAETGALFDEIRAEYQRTIYAPERLPT